MIKLWKVDSNFKVIEIRHNTFIVSFKSQTDKERVFSGRPGLFDNHLLVLKFFDGTCQPNNIRFASEEF